MWENLPTHQLWLRYNSQVTSVSMPEGMTNIGNNTFYQCNHLPSVTIPSTVTSIGNSAFNYCVSLTSVTIPEGVTSIGESAFTWCEGLTSVTIPSTVTNIGGHAFHYCSALTSVTVLNPTPVALSTGNTFSNRASATLYVPYGSKAAYEAADIWNEFGFIEELPGGQCGDNLYWSLNTITGELAITGSGSMYNYSITLQPWADYHSIIKRVSLPAGLTKIGDYAFYQCAEVTSITIPEGVTSIGNYAFRGCK